MHMTLERFDAICAGFHRQRILVVGDVMLDHFLYGRVRRISPEAPVPVVEFVREEYMPGGAGNVARNLATLGAAVDLLSVIGGDVAGRHLHEVLVGQGIGAAGLVEEAGRLTTQKLRITAHQQQMVRVDRETGHPLTAAGKTALLAAWRRALPGAVAVIVADYAKGVVDQELLDALMGEARAAGIPVCIDPKPSRMLRMSGCALLTPNRKEAFELAGLEDPGAGPDPGRDPALLEAVARIRGRHAPAVLLVTLGEAGMLLVDAAGVTHHVPTVAREVFDVSGAGDTVIASFVLAVAAGATPWEAAILANHAAGIVVGKSGTATVTPEELRSWLRSGDFNH
jgi:rfaE bifunctional protein kinase chain/domain